MELFYYSYFNIWVENLIGLLSLFTSYQKKGI